MKVKPIGKNAETASSDKETAVAAPVSDYGANEIKELVYTEQLVGELAVSITGVPLHEASGKDVITTCPW